MPIGSKVDMLVLQCCKLVVCVLGEVLAIAIVMSFVSDVQKGFHLSK